MQAVLLMALIFAVGFGCRPETEPIEKLPAPAPEPVSSLLCLDEGAGFFTGPFPIEHMRRADGTVRYALLPNPDGNAIVQHYIDQADRETQGFSRLGPIYLPFNGPINAQNLPPSPLASLDSDARVFLVDVDPTSPTRGRRVPIHVKWQGRPTVYVPANVLALLPYQGVPMTPNALHAAVVLSSVGDTYGRPLNPSPALAIMRHGKIPKGCYGNIDAAAFARLWSYCAEQGIPIDQVAAATVFRTGKFVDEMIALQDACNDLPDPSFSDLSLLAEFDDFYIVKGKTVLPIWQDGSRSYWTGGGQIHFEAGQPVRQWDEEVRFSVSVPKRPMPEAGYPLLFYVNGQGGTYTQVFDRGGVGSAASVPGTGPGLQFAHRSVACLDIEAATVGPRNPVHSYSGIAFFNFWNLVAFRDNMRQAASEFTLLRKMARNLRIPHELVPLAETDGTDAFFDADNFYLWGHSTGASIAELVLAVDGGFRAGMVSGAGVSWIYNLIMKREPLPLASLFRLLSGDHELDAFHPLSALFQNLCDPAEAAYFAEHWLQKPLFDRPPLNVLILMGLYDQYFPPPMIDGLIVAAGVDLAGPIAYWPTLEALELSGGEVLPLPASDNVTVDGESSTAIAVQFETPESVDGHYAPFYLPEAKHLYSCFFASLAATGKAVAPDPASDSLARCGFE